MRKNQKTNPGSLKPSSRNRISKDTSHSSPISKYFTKPNSENNQAKQNLSSEKPLKTKTVLSDDDADFESPKFQKKKIIKWELTKTKVYSKKSSKNKKPVTNSTIKIIEDNFKDLDVNSEHLQMGIALSKSEYETKKQDTQPPLEESPDVYALTGTILERFGFKSDKPVNRISNFNPTEKSRKRKFKYTTPILITRTEEDREALLTANISLILSRNNRTNNQKQKPTECELFSELLKNCWCKENRIFRSDSIYETQEFTIKELNLSLNRVPCGYLLRGWGLIPAISGESNRNFIKNTEETNTKPDLCSETNQSLRDRHELNESYLDDVKMAHTKSDKNAPNISQDKASNVETPNESFVEAEATHKISCDDYKSNKVDEYHNETDNNFLKGFDSIKPSIVISGNLDTNNLLKQSSPISQKTEFNRSISPDLFGSDCESSFTNCRSFNLSVSFKQNSDVDANRKLNDFTANINSQISDTTNKSKNCSDDDGIIVIDDNDDGSKSIKSTGKVSSPHYDCTKSFNKQNLAKTKVKYSFESDSDGESEIEKNDLENYITDDFNNSCIDSPKKSISSNKKDNVNQKSHLQNNLESKMEQSKTSLTHLSRKDNIILGNKKHNINYSSNSEFDIKICENANDKYCKKTADKSYVSVSKSTSFGNKETSMTVNNHIDLYINIESDFCNKDNKSNEIQVYDSHDKKYSFDSDSDIEFYDTDNKSGSDSEHPNDKNDKHSFELDINFETEYHLKGNKFIETKDCAKKSNSTDEEYGKNGKELSVSNNLCDLPRTEDSIAETNTKHESLTFSPNKFFDENDSAYQNLDITGYINNMLNSQEDTSTNNIGEVANVPLKVSECDETVVKTGQNNMRNKESNSGELSELESNTNCTKSATDDPYDLEENFSQASQSSSFIDELNKTDFCYIPPSDDVGLHRNSTGESGFWFEGKESDPIEILNEDTTENVVASTSNTETLKHYQTNFVTPDKTADTKIIKNMIIKTHNITPMQEYDNMNTPTINKELDKFGIKPLKRARGALLLKHIYESTHPYVSEANEGCQQDSDEDRRMTKKRKSNELFPTLAAAGGVEIVGDSLLENEQLENLIFERKQSVKIKSCAIPLQIVWHNFVSSNPELKENILLYEPLELEVLHQGLKDMGFKFHIQDLLTFLDKKCITVRIKR